MATPRTKFGDAAEVLRQKKRITLTALAKEMNVPPSYLSMIERGKSPLNERIFQLYVKHLADNSEDQNLLQEAAQDMQIVRAIRISCGDKGKAYLLDRLIQRIDAMTNSEILDILHSDPIGMVRSFESYQMNYVFNLQSLSDSSKKQTNCGDGNMKKAA